MTFIIIFISSIDTCPIANEVEFVDDKSDVKLKVSFIFKVKFWITYICMVTLYYFESKSLNLILIIELKHLELNFSLFLFKFSI